MTTRHVVLLTYGEPPTPSFSAQLRYSWRILIGLTRSVAPIPPVLLPLIALSRARMRRDLWTREAYASPLEPVTRRQAARLGEALARRDPATRWRVHVAYEFRDPLLATVLDGIPADATVDVVPMYAADSAFTHDISRRALARWAATRRGGATGAEAARARVVPAIDPERLAEWSALHIRRRMDDLAIEGGRDCALVLAAHGTLLEPPRPMETGREATERIAIGITRRLAGEFGLIANGWLNHVYGGRWTEPPVEALLGHIAAAGYRRVVYFPYGFLADNAESQLEGRIALRGHDGIDAVHLDCLNDAAPFMDALAEELLRTSAEDEREGARSSA